MDVVLVVLLALPYFFGLITLVERKRIVEWISDYVVQAVYQMIQEQMKMWLVDDREQTVKVLKPLMSELVNELIKEYQKNPEKLEPGEKMVKLPIVGKVPLSLVMQFLGKQGMQKAEEMNPFA